MAIEQFQGEYRWLSNFALVRVIYNGLEFTSTEAAYQAAKSNVLNQQMEFTSLSPGQAKRLGKRITMRPDWNKVKLSIMEDLLRQKFNVTLYKELLLLTGNEEIIEGNYWHDTYWGVCNGIGENNLGKLIMKIRKELIL
jgi:ribA/ribD-fused uncharacterized protein